MPKSRIKVLGDGYKHLINLTSINLSGCHYLTKVSDLSGSPNLQHLDLNFCESLVEVHPSVGFLDKLEYLGLIDRSRLETFPTEVGWKSMRRLLLPSCGMLDNFIKIAHNMESIKTLNLMDSGIKEPPSWIGCCISLEDLWLAGTSIKQQPLTIENPTSLRELDLSRTPLKELPSSIGYLTSLRELDLSRTPLKELPSSIGYCTSLVELDASETLIEELPLSIGNLICLRKLKLKGCANLTNVPHGVYGGLQNLRSLDLSWCPKLVTFPSRGSALVSSSAESLPLMLPSNSNNGHDHPGSLLFPQLWRLEFEGCQLSVVSDFLTNLDCASTLWSLNLSGSSFDSLPAWISKFHLLDYLDLSGCKRLRDISELPPNIRVIKLDDCVSLERFSKLSNILEQKDTPGRLQSMHLSNCNRLMDNLGMDVVSKMAKALPYQLVHAGLDQHLKCWNLILPSLQEIEVPNWFDGGEVDTSVLPGHGTHGICEISIKIPRNLKAERIGLVVCVVFELTQDFSGVCLVRVVIDKKVCYDSTRHFLKSKATESSAQDHVLVHLTCIAFKELEVLDSVVRVSYAPSYPARGLLLKSFGVHLANMKEDHVSGEDLARERYRQSNACISDQVALHAEGAAVASLVSDDSNYGEIHDDHHNGE